MSFSEARVLAIGLDAAEPTLIRELIEQGEMPALKALLEQGKWLRVESPASVGSGSVWPTFITGEEPSIHGVYGEWCWRPATMSLERYRGDGLIPFWKRLVDNGLTVGILDVPFAPLVGIADGFEISEWGPHDLLKGQLEFFPPEITEIVKQQTSPHPLSSDRLDAAGPMDYDGLRKLSVGCLEGVKLRGALAHELISKRRPRLSLITFTEIHHSAHYLWHNIVPAHEIYNQSSLKTPASVKPTLNEIYREVDRQIGALVTIAAADAVLVFSLHGMQASHGIPSFLGPLLCEKGFARLAAWGDQSWFGRAVTLMGAIKRRTPAALKKLYYKSITPGAAQRFARPTMIPEYDWNNTCAFSLPTDQHGWIRINLRGREARGIVAPEEYQQTCQQLEQLLHSLTTSEGRPLVRRVIRSAKYPDGHALLSLPDLVVHWENAAFSSPLKIQGSGVSRPPAGTKFTGQHSLEGFCIIRGSGDFLENDFVRVGDLGQVISTMLKSPLVLAKTRLD